MNYNLFHSFYYTRIAMGLYVIENLVSYYSPPHSVGINKHKFCADLDAEQKVSRALVTK